MSIKLTLPVPPSVNQAYGLTTQYVGGRAIPLKYLTPKAKSYKSYVAKTCKRAMKEQKIDFLTKEKNEFVEMEICFYLNRKRRDADNTFKLMFDGIVSSGMIPDDDIILYSVKNIYIDREDPRVEVVIKKSEKTGIFENYETFSRFKENNCAKCKKSTYKRTCSTIRDALDNILNEDINLERLECEKIVPNNTK